jgi:hypothetical protein
MSSAARSSAKKIMPVSSSSSFSTLLDVPFSEDNRPSFAEAQVLLNDFLAFVPLLHAQFARYDEIDALRRQEFVQSSLLAPSPPPITPGENMMVDVALASAGALNWKRLHGTVREPVGYFVAEHEEKYAAGWGRTESEVDASQEETLAWILDYASYRRTEIHEDRRPGVLRRCIKVPRSRSSFQVTGITMPPGVDNRVFATWFVWRREGGGDLVAAFGPYQGEHARASPSGARPSGGRPGGVRASAPE